MKTRLRMENGKGKAFLALAVALLIFTAAACNWELNAYRALATAQVSYEQYWKTVVALHEQGVADAAYYAKAEDVAKRIFNLGQSTTTLIVEYKKLRDPAIKARIDAAILELPILLAALSQFARGIKPAADGKYDRARGEEFIARTAPFLCRADDAVHLIESLLNQNFEPVLEARR